MGIKPAILVHLLIMQATSLELKQQAHIYFELRPNIQDIFKDIMSPHYDLPTFLPDFLSEAYQAAAFPTKNYKNQ